MNDVKAYAVQHHLPCLNPNCSSGGRPHYGCLCYGGGGPGDYAEGGDVPKPCSSPECLAIGGEVDSHHEVARKAISGHLEDEEKWALGAEDKEHAVASALVHMGAHHLLNKDGKGAYSDNSSGMRQLSNKKAAQKIAQYLANPNSQPMHKFAEKLSGGSKIAQAMIMKMVSNGETDGLPNLLSYLNGVKKGSKNIDSAIEALLSGSGSIEKSPAPDENDKLDEYVKNGKYQQQLEDQKNAPEMFAGGGDVKAKPILAGTDPMAKNLPAHNALLHGAKGRINNYLNSIRPNKESGGLFYDKEHENPEDKRSYEKALSLANNPLGILGHVKDGSITPETMKHFVGLYPEVYDHLSKKLTKKMLEGRLKDQAPPYHSKQALSLFMGSTLDSTLTPESIQAAQSAFGNQGQPQQQEQGPQSKGKKGTAKIDKIPDQYRTPEEATEMRELKR